MNKLVSHCSGIPKLQSRHCRYAVENVVASPHNKYGINKGIVSITHGKDRDEPFRIP
jgi:hypothetical protein